MKKLIDSKFYILNSRSGFTLFELLVVISIIGILAGLGSVAYSSSQRRARDARRKQDMDALQTALEQYYALSGGDYPGIDAGDSGSIEYNDEIIMQSLPQDPRPEESYYGGVNVSENTYCFCAQMETDVGNFGADDCSTAGNSYYCVSQRQ